MSTVVIPLIAWCRCQCFAVTSYNAYRSLRDKFAWQNLQYLVANKPLFWIEALSRWSEDIDGQHNWPALSLSRLKYFFFSTRLAFFSFDSNFKISTRVFFFFSFVNICFANLDSYFLLDSVYFTSFDLRIMFLTCFYHRYNFVHNGTPYLPPTLLLLERDKVHLWTGEWYFNIFIRNGVLNDDRRGRFRGFSLLYVEV